MRHWQYWEPALLKQSLCLRLGEQRRNGVRGNKISDSVWYTAEQGRNW